jgi:phosphate transport system substrate-binding protein
MSNTGIAPRRNGLALKAANLLAAGALMLGLAPAGLSTVAAQSQQNCRTFAETGNKRVCDRFLDYWSQSGGLAQQGYPLTDAQNEVSDINGKTYLTQYFERAVFELHPENQRPYDVLLSLLGVFEMRRRYGADGPEGQKASTTNSLRFSQTGKTVGGKFREYWEKSGGLAQQGYPITDEFTERSNLNGKEYTVQYFERAVFELHPENQAPYDVLLAQVGRFRLSLKQAGTGKVVPPDNQEGLRRLSGQVIIDGSSTVYPVTAAASEEFNQYAPNVRVPVGVSGTGGGFQKFCNGESDIQNASRPVNPTETQRCKDKQIQYIELPVAYDGLAVVVNPQNTWVDFLTVEELKKMWEPGAQGKITNWNQIRPSFPDRPLRLYGPGTDSGTFEYFTEAIVGRARSSRGDYQASEDDNVLVQGISGDAGALGYFGYAYVVENQGKVKAVPIKANANAPAVAPSIDTVKNATYQPLSRPLFIYVKRTSADRPEVQAFVNFYLSKSFTPLIQTREVGYIALTDELYKSISNRFKFKVVGTLFPNGAEVGATLDRYLGR